MKYVSYLVHLEIKREESLTLPASSLNERRIRSVDVFSQDLMLLYQYYVVDSSCETPTDVISDSVRADSETIITEHVCVSSPYMNEDASVDNPTTFSIPYLFATFLRFTSGFMHSAWDWLLYHQVMYLYALLTPTSPTAQGQKLTSQQKFLSASY